MKKWNHIWAASQNKSGAALLTVLVALFLITLMTFELYYVVNVERRMAYNDINQLKAYYLAKSGVNIGILRLALYGRTRKMANDFQKMAPGVNIKQYLEMIWALPLPPFPPAKSSIAKLTKPDQDAAEKVLSETKVSEGQFTEVISSESGKINLNFLVVPEAQRNERIEFRGTPNNLVEHTGTMLVNLLEKFLRESERPSDEYGNMKPEEVVYDIMDWINPGTTRIMGGSKDAFYEDQVPPYKAKRGRFFSVEELRLVKGIDDHLFNKLRPYVTVYSYEGKLNLNEMSSEMLKVIYPDFSEEDIKRLNEEKAKVGSWKDEKTFADFVVNNLGRTGFQTLYGTDPANYPFTVSSQSFLVESMGQITRSGSSIQKLIRVAAALTPARAGMRDGTINQKDQCDATANRFWWIGGDQCRVKPRTRTECQDARVFPPAQWEQVAGKDCCRIIGSATQLICLDPAKDKGGEEPNALKILHWTEI